MILRGGVVLLAAVGLASGAGAAVQGKQAGDGWPCSDPPPAIPDASWFWAGADYDTDWRSDEAVAALVAQISQRSMPETQAVARVAEFAAGHIDRPRTMAKLGSGLIDSMGGEQRTVVDGIRRFNVRQAALARRIEAAYAQFDAQSDSAGAKPDSATAAVQEQVRWDTQIFEDRQRLLPVMCRIPGTINARLGTLLAAAAGGAGSDAGAAGYLIYASDEKAGEISIIDPVRRTEIGRIGIGKRPRGLVASPDHRFLYVAVSGSPIGGPDVDEASLPPPDKAADGIAVIDLATRAVVRTLRGISDPEQLAISPEGRRLYVASEDAGQLFALDPDGTIVAKLSVGGEPEGVAVSSDGSIVLATSEEDSKVAVIRTDNSIRVISRLPVGERPRNVVFLGNGRALVPAEFGSSLTIIDYDKGRALRTIVLGADDRPMNLRIGPDGLAYVTTGRSGKLLKIDPGDTARARPVIASATVGARPWGVALSPDGKTAFTANGPSDDVTAINLQTMRILGKIPVRGGPWGVVAVPARP